MNTLPGPAMLDSKLFVSRRNDPFPDLYERLWDGVEWIWVNHGRPQGIRVRYAPGAAMLDEKLFVPAEDGGLWERRWRADLGRWVWESHGRPGNQQIIAPPGAAMMNEKLFVATDAGNLWERHWRADLDRWAWEDHGRPGNQKIIAAPGAAMMNEKLFAATDAGNLWERHWRADLDRWAWEDHGRPGDEKIVAAPGAAMLNEKLFVVTDAGNLWERHWRADLGRWAWENHGRPGDEEVNSAPGAAMLDEKLFVTSNAGNVWERQWRNDLGRWAWASHGRPAGARAATEPAGAMLNAKFFVGGDDDCLYERTWTGSAWTWVNHGTPLHDQSAHVIGAPGSEPKLTVAVMGDGYAEADMDKYRSLVDDKVVKAFQLDQLGDNIAALRVVRIDVVSPVSGVTERTYDENDTLDPADDTLLREESRDSRLGFVATGLWSHCWIEKSARTDPRIESIRRRFAPDADTVVVLVNSGEPGGCNRGDVAAFTRGEKASVIAHELGHNLFALGDEYNNDTRNFTGTAGEANLSERPASWNDFKWRDLVAGATPLPTDPHDLPRGWNRRTSVGAFEGGGGDFASGIFHPVLECRMNQNNPPWCPVCAREIARVLGEYL